MLHIKSQRSFQSSSKRLNRRARVTFEDVKIKSLKILPLFVLALLLYLGNKFLTINKIDCATNNGECPASINIFLNKFVHQNSVLINQKEIGAYLKGIYPIENLSINFHIPNTLKVRIFETKLYVDANVFLVQTLPTLSMDQAPSSTDSAGWWTKPTKEIKDFTQTKQSQSFYLYDTGIMTPSSTGSAIINYIFSVKPSSENISSIYRLTKLISKYTDVLEIFILDNRFFLSRPSQPDIIVNVPFDEASLTSALQSLSYLATIKKDAKVIDLSFKNPIIR